MAEKRKKAKQSRRTCGYPGCRQPVRYKAVLGGKVSYRCTRHKRTFPGSDSGVMEVV